MTWDSGQRASQGGARSGQKQTLPCTLPMPLERQLSRCSARNLRHCDRYSQPSPGLTPVYNTSVGVRPKRTIPGLLVDTRSCNDALSPCSTQTYGLHSHPSVGGSNRGTVAQVTDSDRVRTCIEAQTRQLAHFHVSPSVYGLLKALKRVPGFRREYHLILCGRPCSSVQLVPLRLPTYAMAGSTTAAFTGSRYRYEHL